MSPLVVSLVIIGIRILLAPLILVWPVGGVIINILADAWDAPLAQHFGWGLLGSGHYQRIDKLLDTWYLFFAFLVVMRRWKDPLARRTARVLFYWRLAGVILLEITGLEGVLALAPNIFEYFYLFWAVVLKWFKGFRLTRRRLVVILFTLGILKLADELRLHWFHVGPNIINNYIIPRLFGS